MPIRRKINSYLSKCFVYLNLQPVTFNFPFNHIVSFFTTIKTKSLKRDQENDKFIQNHNGIQMPSHILTAAFETFTNIFIEDVSFITLWHSQNSKYGIFFKDKASKNML